MSGSLAPRGFGNARMMSNYVREYILNNVSEKTVIHHSKNSLSQITQKCNLGETYIIEREKIRIERTNSIRYYFLYYFRLQT